MMPRSRAVRGPVRVNARNPVWTERAQKAHAPVLLSLMGCLLTACIPPYSAPTPDMPHALLKFRRRYGGALGPAISESLSINDRPALAREGSAWDALVPSTDVVLAHPGRVTLGADAFFWHLDREPGYPMGYCGGPRFSASCYSPHRTVRVVDAACSRSLEVEVRAGEVYLIELDFVDASACRLVCYRQKALGPGRIQMLPCGQPP